MKTIVMAGLAAAALSLTALGQQRASAQSCPPQCTRGGDVNFNLGLTLGLHWTPCKGHWVPNCPTCGYPPPPPYAYPPPYAAYGNPPFQPPQPTAVAAPNPPTAANPPKAPSGLQNIGYNYAPGYNPNYGYNYGYMGGFPYSQAPDYWYGR